MINGVYTAAIPSFSISTPLHTINNSYSLIRLSPDESYPHTLSLALFPYYIISPLNMGGPAVPLKIETLSGPITLQALPLLYRSDPLGGGAGGGGCK